MNINEQKKYVFKQPYESPNGTIPEGMEIILFHGHVYANGGICDSYSSGLLMHIINDDKLRNKYLVQMKVVNNKL